jgi:beta propeller repeat protein
MKNRLPVCLGAATFALLTACGNDVAVTAPSESASSSLSSSVGVSSSGSPAEAGSSASEDLLNLIDQNSSSSWSKDGISSSSLTSVSSSSGDLLSSGEQTSSSSGISSTIAESSSSAAAALGNFQVLTTLNTIELPSLSEDGIRIVQTKSDGTLGVLQVSWAGSSSWIASENTLYYAYLTATGTHFATLFQASSSWTLQSNESVTLGSPATNYKEFIASNSEGIFWVDYGTASSSGSGRGGTGTGSSDTSLKGRILFQSWNAGAIDTLTSETSSYRARLEASEGYLAWVEYAPEATVGKIALMNLNSGAITYPATSSHHQDRPSVDGDWLVWEEYLNSTDAVIRAYQISTQTTLNLSSSTGFRTNPYVSGSKVVWEDQRTGNGDLWYYDFNSAKGETILVSGEGHSAGVRFLANRIVWVESSTTSMGLLTATWQ